MKNSRILVVEDSATQAEALRALLEEHGCVVVVAGNGISALDLLSDSSFDIVLSDVVMPGINGYELCRRIKQRPEWRETPVVLLTSLTDPMDIVRGLECGADNYITKPYEADHLLARLRHVLDNRRLRRGSKTSLGVTVRFLGNDLNITSEREQILDLFISSVEDVVRTNEALQRRERELAQAKAQLEAFAREKSREAKYSAGRYEALLQNAGDAIIVLGTDDRIIEVNQRACDILGRVQADLLGQSLTDLMPDSDWEKIRRQLSRLGSAGRVDLGVRRFSDANGVEIWCELTGSLTPLNGEELVLLIARDVTERRRTEQRLYETNERLSTVIEASPLAIIALDAEGRVQQWNKAAERIFGWTEQEALYRRPFTPDEEPEQECGDLIQRALQGEVLAGVEAVRVRKDGTPLEVSIYSAPLRAQGGEITGCVGVLADITERKRAEAALRDREEVERANRAKSEFLSRMSHELRTPLNAILGFAQLLEMGDLSADEIESVEQILRGGRHLLDLINEVLDLSRIEAGKITLSLEPVSVRSVVRDAMSLINPLADLRQIAFVTNAIDDVDQFVFADLQRLKQVVLNFLSNAVKYNRVEGTVTVVLSRVANDQLRIGIHDTGPGLTPDELARLFVPFERLEADELEIEGTGLGLALSKGLAEAMGGRVGAESVVGEGSTFWIELPLVEEPKFAVNSPRGDPARSLSVLNGERTYVVLYIEDNTSNLRLVERVLARPGIRLLTAMQGRLGFDLAQEHHPDLILLDLNLPDIRGEEVLLRLKGHPTLRETPVVVISADAMPSQAARLLDAGAREYLTKPLDMRRFIQVVDEALNGLDS